MGHLKRYRIAIASAMAIGVGGTLVDAAVADEVGPAPSVTAGYDYVAYGLARHADLEAHMSTATSPAKGELNYSDAAGRFYAVAVDCVTVSGNIGVFEGVVHDASNPAWDGLFLLVKLINNGSPGTNGDLASGSFFVSRQPCDGSITPPDGPFPLTNGNVVVHS